jgi:hypothetical protein
MRSSSAVFPMAPPMVIPDRSRPQPSSLHLSVFLAVWNCPYRKAGLLLCLSDRNAWHLRKTALLEQLAGRGTIRNTALEFGQHSNVSRGLARRTTAACMPAKSANEDNLIKQPCYWLYMYTDQVGAGVSASHTLLIATLSDASFMSEEACVDHKHLLRHVLGLPEIGRCYYLYRLQHNTRAEPTQGLMVLHRVPIRSSCRTNTTCT